MENLFQAEPLKGLCSFMVLGFTPGLIKAYFHKYPQLALALKLTQDRPMQQSGACGYSHLGLYQTRNSEILDPNI